jgi:hypothetical protein
MVAAAACGGTATTPDEEGGAGSGGGDNGGASGSAAAASSSGGTSPPSDSGASGSGATYPQLDGGACRANCDRDGIAALACAYYGFRRGWCESRCGVCADPGPCMTPQEAADFCRGRTVVGDRPGVEAGTCIVCSGQVAE